MNGSAKNPQVWLKYGLSTVCSAIRSMPASAIATTAVATAAPNSSRARRNMPTAAIASSAAASGASTCQVASPDSDETAANA